MAKVEFKYETFTELIDNDSGSGAYLDLATWRPNRKFFWPLIHGRSVWFTDTTTQIVSDGWYYLGPAATNSSSVPGTGIVVRELESDVLLDVDDWIQVWNDAGSGKSTDFALWRGVGPSSNYIVVGGFFTRSHNKPTAEQTRGIKAIHKDALRDTSAAVQIWTDHGSSAAADGAVWTISNSGVFATGAFIPVKGYNNPPEDAYGLALDQTEVQWEFQVRVEDESQCDCSGPKFVNLLSDWWYSDGTLRYVWAKDFSSYPCINVLLWCLMNATLFSVVLNAAQLKDSSGSSTFLRITAREYQSWSVKADIIFTIQHTSIWKNEKWFLTFEKTIQFTGW